MTAMQRDAAVTAPELCWFQDVNRGAVALVGGKNASLGELINAGVRVPPGFAITTAGFRRFIREGGIADALAGQLAGIDHEDLQALEARSSELRGLIESTPFSIEFEDLIAEYYRRLGLVCCLPATPVAVRSSATAEDLPGASFAGQQDTYLWIRGVDDVLAHVRRCIGSLFTARAIAYRARMGFGHEQVAISVGVQKMANSFAAGVMFTLDPANGDRSVIAIDSNFGFGESVVSGEVTPDHFVVNKVSLDIIGRTISRKERCYTVDFSAQRSRAQEVPFERQTVQSIIDEEVIELARMGKRIENHYGRPLDIEWAVDKDLPAGGNIFILQARPETVWASKQPARPARAPASALDHILHGMLSGRRIG
jgi:pyruvate,water dikinase